MKTFRKVIFWTHLSAGATAGVVIFIMCVTGALLSFERQIIEYSERGARYVEANTASHRLEPQKIIDSVKAARPETKPSSMLITNEPGATWQVNLGRDGMLFVDPYSAEVVGHGNPTVRGVMTELRNWHRYIALSGDKRDAGKAITGVSNILFLFLAISGLYIWFPRKPMLENRETGDLVSRECQRQGPEL